MEATDGAGCAWAETAHNKTSCKSLSFRFRYGLV
jgi:hypothetical protein